MKFIVFTFFLIFFHYTPAQSIDKVELTDYVKDILMWKKVESKMTMTFWIPSSYWRVALRDSPEVSDEIISQIEDSFKDYVLVCISETDLAGGKMQYTSEKTLRNSLTIQDSLGNKYTPIKESKVDPHALMLTDAMKPIFTKMMGEMGSGMHFFFFKVQNKLDENIIDEFKDGKFTVSHSKQNFEYLLPLPSLLPSQECPVDGEAMKGNWKFCPIHGVELNN